MSKIEKTKVPSQTAWRQFSKNENRENKRKSKKIFLDASRNMKLKTIYPFFIIV